jgi:hypothetical protein
MALNAFDRAMVYRWLAGGLLWLLIIAVVLVSIRSSNIASRAGRAAVGAVTAEQEQSMAEVREVARAFAVEWATWNGNTEDYTRRLGVFLKRPDPTLPDGIQEVTSTSVRSVDGGGEKYRVRVLLHTRRLTPLSAAEAQALPQVFVPVTREDLIRAKQEGFSTIQDRSVPAWREYMTCVEVPVRVRDGRPEVSGLPVIVSTGAGQGEMSEPYFNETAPPEFVAFINQFLGLYYGGGSLANFLAPGARVAPVSGWKLESVGEVRVNNSKIPDRAYVRAAVSAPGVGRLEQRIYVQVQPERGSYLVKDVSAAE